MEGRERSGWTVAFIRRGKPRSHAFRLSATRAALLACVLALVVILGGFAIGLHWQKRADSARISELSAQVARLSAERTQMMELASRLERMEGDYRGLQQVMGGRGSNAGRDIWLRPLPTDESGNGAVVATDAILHWPLAKPGYITRSHGAASSSWHTSHDGIDIAVPGGSYVRSSGGGRVSEVGVDSVYGRYVRVLHADGLSTLYGHNSWTFVAEGDTVEAREVIALAGSTGQSTGPHLHFETRRYGQQIDPLELLGR